VVIPEFFISLTLAVLLTALYKFMTRRAGRKKGLIWLFLTLFLAIWAAGLWLKPFGPILWGIHWLTFLLVGLIIVLFFLIVIPKKPPRGRHETLDMLERIEQKEKMEEATYITLNIFFWILLALLVTVIIFRYTIDVDSTWFW
jgi:hypothetical protein